MAKEIKDLRHELEAMKSAMLDANAGRKIDTSKLQLFPDVPQNHWAYEYVATLAGNGMIQATPTGTFVRQPSHDALRIRRHAVPGHVKRCDLIGQDPHRICS